MFYADANAGVPSSERHLKQVFRLLQESDGNPSSMHKYGRKARVAIETARRDICSYLHIDSEKFIFTSGGTESNNLIIHAFAAPHAQSSELPHILITAGDHPSIRNTAQTLAEQQRCALDTIPITKAGIVAVEQLPKLVRPNTVLACLTHANSETGVINPVADIASAIKELNPNTHVHCDAVQALGKIELNDSLSTNAQLDSASFSAHKLGALKGCGGLYLKNSLPRAQMYGGSHEFNLRAGTENLAGIISFGCVVKALPDQLSRWQQHVAGLKSILLEELATTDALMLAGDSPCLPNTVYVHLPRTKVEDLILNLDLAGIAVSSGSACSSGISRPSTTLTQMGYDSQIASNALRISFGQQGTADDVKKMLVILKKCWASKPRN
ncbi:MAG: cysteine desulfurase family protein [Pseudomonadota bacterium]|nr:cysteine desulfurase family protein [Pseudomonadota bacterium]